MRTSWIVVKEKYIRYAIVLTGVKSRLHMLTFTLSSVVNGDGKNRFFREIVDM